MVAGGGGGSDMLEGGGGGGSTVAGRGAQRAARASTPAQMVILLDMTQSWNDAWVAEGDEDPRFL